MAKDQTVTDRVSRRQFASVASAAAAGFLLTACGPRRLHEIPRDRLREAIKEWERDYSEKYAKAVHRIGCGTDARRALRHRAGSLAL